MSNAQLRPVNVDPWVAPTGSLESDYHLSRQAAERASVLQAFRERRNALRPARQPLRPARVEPATSVG